MKSIPYIWTSAILSDDKVYRYTLTRRWSIATPPRVMMFVMLNPSTADQNVDDPTIRRCVTFARANAHTELVVCNLFAYRATDPQELLDIHGNVVGPENDQCLGQMASRADTIVAAWGAFIERSPYLGHRAQYVKDNLAAIKDVWCLGKTQRGSPRHPLYVKGDTKLTLYAAHERWR